MIMSRLKKASLFWISCFSWKIVPGTWMPGSIELNNDIVLKGKIYVQSVLLKMFLVVVKSICMWNLRVW